MISDLIFQTVEPQKQWRQFFFWISNFHEDSCLAYIRDRPFKSWICNFWSCCRHLCNSINFRDKKSFIEIWVFQNLHFCKKSAEIIMLNCEKCKNSRKLHILFLIIPLKPFKSQRCTIPHFKTLDLLFWPLAWLLTLGSILCIVWCKTFVYFFLYTL